MMLAHRARDSLPHKEDKSDLEKTVEERASERARSDVRSGLSPREGSDAYLKAYFQERDERQLDPGVLTRDQIADIPDIDIDALYVRTGGEGYIPK